MAAITSQRREAPRARSSDEVVAVAIDGPERGQEGEPERDDRARDGEHDVQRLGVQRVAGGGVELVGEVVDELDLAGQRSLDPVDDLARRG